MNESDKCKVCISCNQAKTQNEFSKDKSSKDGLWRYCKPCSSSLRKAKYTRLTEEQLKASYLTRQDKSKETIKRTYENKPELRIEQSKRKSKAIIATHIDNGSVLEFESATKAKSFGFDNTNIGKVIGTNIPYKKYLWKFKVEV